jgi:SAM-dependent methyltransferase
MHPTEIGRSYDTLAQSWQERLASSKYGIPQFERALKFAKGRHTALDIGCGSDGRVIDLLLEHGFHVEGLDVSEKMIALAKELHPETSFYLADIAVWTLPRQYDFISAWDSIWHLPLAAQEPVMQKICEGLKAGGIFLFTMGGLDEPGEKRDSNMGPPTYYSTLGVAKVLELLARFGCICRHLEYDQYPEQHVYVIAQKFGIAAESNQI